MYLFCFFLEFSFRGASSEVSALHTRWFTCVSCQVPGGLDKVRTQTSLTLFSPSYLSSYIFSWIEDVSCLIKNVSRVPNHVGDRIDLGPEGPAEVITYKAQ